MPGRFSGSLGNGSASTPVGMDCLGRLMHGNVDLFAPTFEPGAFNTEQHYSIVDPATPNVTPSFNAPTWLQTSAANSAFRGVAIVPQATDQLLLGERQWRRPAIDLSDLSIVLNNFGATTSLRSNGNFDGGHLFLASPTSSAASANPSPWRLHRIPRGDPRTRIPRPSRPRLAAGILAGIVANPLTHLESQQRRPQVAAVRCPHSQTST